MTIFDNGQAASFVEGETIYVVSKSLTGGTESDGYTFECLTYTSEDDGVRFTYTDPGETYRVFLPTHMIRRVFQIV